MSSASGTPGSATARQSGGFQVSKRAPKACSNCHRRKVRCDAHMHPEGQPCSYCKSTGHECVLLPGRRGSTYQKTKKRLAAAAQAAGNVQVQQQHSPTSPPSQQPQQQQHQQQQPMDVEMAQMVNPDPSAYGVVPQMTHSVLSPKQEMLTSPGSPASHDHGNPSLSDEHVWVQFLDKVHDQHDHTHGNVLEQQFAAQTNNFLRPVDHHDPAHQHHIHHHDTRENSTDPHGDTKQRVLVYNGETMLDGVVPTISGLHQVRDASAALDPSFSFPQAATYGPPEGWSTFANVKHVYDAKFVMEDDKRYLIEHKKVHVFPSAEICDRLVKSFFKHVYPNIPILDRPSFLRGYRRMMFNNHIYSLLLMHSVFYAATYHASSSLITACGFPNRLAARAYFFSRAKLLHSLDVEKEHLFIIQSCIMLTLWWTRYEEEKETRFFMSAAIMLGQRMGMHRTIRGGWGLGLNERRLWKRIWWTLYNRDHISASSLGKPPIIRTPDMDSIDLSEEDFLENWGDMDEADAKQFCPPQTIINIKYTLELVKLSKLCKFPDPYKNRFGANVLDERIHCVQYCVQRRPTQEELETIATDIVNWRTQLPPELSTSRYDELRTWTPDNFWPILLQLLHDRAVSLHYRPRCSQPKRAFGQGDIAEIDQKEREKARKAVVASASSTFRLVEDLLRHDLLRYCPPIVQTPLFIAMIVYAEEIKLSPPSSPRFNLATNKINLGMLALGELRKIWAASSWAFRMFEYIIDRKFEPIATPDITGGDPSDVSGLASDMMSHYDPPTTSNDHENNNDDQDLTAVTDPALLQESADLLNIAGAARELLPAPPQETQVWNSGSSPHDADDLILGDGDGDALMDGTNHENGIGGTTNIDFDLTWMAMSGLAGDMPFHFEGQQSTGGKGVVSGPTTSTTTAAAAAAAAAVASAANNANIAGGGGAGGANAKGGGDLWTLLGLGDGAI